MAFHMQVGAERIAQAYEFLDTVKSLEIYGEPGDAFVEQIKQAASYVIVKSKFAGFNRLAATGVSGPAS